MENMQTSTHYVACYVAFTIPPFPSVSSQVVNCVTYKEME